MATAINVVGVQYKDGTSLDGITISGTTYLFKNYNGITIGGITYRFTTWKETDEEVDEPSVIGFTGLTDSSGTLTWTDDIADLNDSAAYTTSTSGTNVTVTGALDDVFPFNAIKEYTDSSGNVFIAFPKFYMKWVSSSGVVDGIKISDKQVDDDYFIPDCFLNTDGTDYNDYFYMGKYEGSGSSSKVYSVTGATPLVSITRANFRTGCRAYGSSSNAYNGYQQLDMQMYTMYNFLCMLYYRTANIQNVYVGRTSASGGSSWSAASVTGTTDSISGLNGWSTTTDCVKMLGVENPYGNIFAWVDGIYFSSSTVYIHRLAPNYADSTTNATALGYSRPTSNGYISKLSHGSSTPTRSVVYATAVGGSSSTYVGDYCWYSSSGTVLYVGGYWDYGTSAGLWLLNGYATALDTGSGVGGRLCLRPRKVGFNEPTIEDIEDDY